MSLYVYVVPTKEGKRISITVCKHPLPKYTHKRLAYDHVKAMIRATNTVGGHAPVLVCGNLYVVLHDLLGKECLHTAIRV